MIHYLLVRRDLPFGVTLAQLAHAAADSMAEWLKDEAFSSDDSYFIDFPNTEGMTVVVLGVKDQAALKRWEKKLIRNRSPYLHIESIREPDAPWNGQLMAIGIWPGPREVLGPIFKNLQTFRFEDWTGQEFKRLEDVR